MVCIRSATTRRDAMCVALTILGIVALVIVAAGSVIVSVFRRLNASAIKGDEDWGLPPGDMFDPHRRQP